MKTVALSAQGQRKLRAVLKALVFANLVVCCSVSLFFYAWQASVLDNARREHELAVSNLAQSLSQTINAELTLVDAGLKHIAYNLDASIRMPPVTPETIDAMLRSQQDLIPFVDSLLLTDAQGNVMFGKGADRWHLINIAQQKIFKQVLDSRDGDLLVSEPHISPLNQQWVLTLARRLQHRDGSFSGMLFATVDSGHFSSLFSSVQLGTHGAISLRTASLQLVARVSTDQTGPTAIGSNTVSTELSQALKRGPLFGVYASPTALDGIDRRNAFCRVLNFPLLVIAGQGMDIYQGPWLKPLSQIGFLCFLCLLALALMSWLAYGATQRELNARDAMEREFEHSRTLIDASSDGIHVLNAAGDLVQSNAMFAQLLGYREDFLLGRPLAFWCDQPLVRLAAVQHAGAPTEPGRVDARYRKSDGGHLDVEVRFRQLPSPQGLLTVCSARDITARKAVEQTLLRTSAMLQALGQASNSGWLVVHHRTDSIQCFNHRFCVLWNLEHLEPALQANKLSFSQLLLAMQPLLARPQEFFANRLVQEDEIQLPNMQDRIALVGQRGLRRFSMAVQDAGGGYVGRLYIFDEDIAVSASRTPDNALRQSFRAG
jgi:PAS domain S-box-containing protein